MRKVYEIKTNKNTNGVGIIPKCATPPKVQPCNEQTSLSIFACMILLVSHFWEIHLSTRVGNQAVKTMAVKRARRQT